MSPSKQIAVVDLFDSIAPVYDRLNHIISWGNDQRWRRMMAAKMDLHPGQIVLDVAAGTGDMEKAVRIVCPQSVTIGLDPARHMLAFHRRKLPSSAVVQATAERFPLRGYSIPRMVCAFGVRNFKDRRKALQEIYRVLEPGGLWGFLEMSAPQGGLFSLFYALYFKRLMPLIGALISFRPEAYRYLRDSVYAFPGYKEMLSDHQEIGFSLYHYHPILHGAVGLYIFKKA